MEFLLVRHHSFVRSCPYLVIHVRLDKHIGCCILTMNPTSVPHDGTSPSPTRRHHQSTGTDYSDRASLHSGTAHASEPVGVSIQSRHARRAMARPNKASSRRPRTAGGEYAILRCDRDRERPGGSPLRIRGTATRVRTRAGATATCVRRPPGRQS